MRRLIAWLVGIALVVSACEGTDLINEGSVEKRQGSTTSERSTTTVRSEGTKTVLPIPLAQVTGAWSTDFSKTTIDLSELLVGIGSSDPRDAIPPIDDPSFEKAADSRWIQDREPGVLLEIEDDVRFYPLSIMTRHEIVNDVVSGTPVAVTYCPLCNTALAFDRRFEGKTLRLGVSGLLRNSDLVMWDDVTQTLWQQVTGEAIVGVHAGKELTRLATSIVRWQDFKETHPDGLVLVQDQGFGRVYGLNPYEFYSSRAAPYGFYQGEIDDRFPALERVLGLTIGTTEKAYPFSLISQTRVVNDQVAGRAVVVFWGSSDTADALDKGNIADSAGIGTAVAYDPVIDGRTMTFIASGDTVFEDDQTGSTWSILGKALSGELAGQELELLPNRNEFWFAWQAFFPDGEVWEG